MNTSPHYTVLARRFRPQTFDEVIGQQPVAQALRNAMSTGRVAHAYLFTGARGVGKTSMARILAKSLNCPNSENGTPCNQCDLCQSISHGSDVDVLEIDGASNRGIDDVRSLRANVNVKPMRARYKIYIIDEVHMLTKEAFNALLKTLEEPPANVQFIFCTTEPNRVPDTILSRCQRFDFATIETQNIVARLAEIAAADGYEVEPAALELIARRASGSMRDSQSLFDQLLAFGEEHITPEDVHRLLGTASDDRLIEINSALLSRRRDEVLQQFDEALADGVQLSELFDQILAYFRDLMVLATGAEQVELHAVSEAHRFRLVEQSAEWGLSTIVAAMQILAEAQTRMFRATSARALGELALVRITLLEELDELSGLIGQLQSGGGGASSDSSGSPSVRKPSTERQPTRPRPSPPNPRVDANTSESETVNQPVVERQPIPLTPGNESELLSQLISIVDDRLRDHLRVVSRSAIFEPNGLELIFPKSYHFSKQYCEQQKNSDRLHQIASQCVGGPVRLRFQIEDEAEESESVPSTTANSSRRPVESIDDPFVQKVVAVFEGTVMRVESIHSSINGDESVSS